MVNYVARRRISIRCSGKNVTSPPGYWFASRASCAVIDNETETVLRKVFPRSVVMKVLPDLFVEAS